MIGSSPNAIKYHENPIAEDLAEERRNVLFTNTIIFCILVSIVFVIITVSILIVIIVILEVNYQEVEKKTTQIVEDQSRYSHNFIRLNESNQTVFNDPIYSKFNKKNSSRKALVCNLGYSGPDCQDECGVTIFTPNLRIFNPLNRIVGGYEAWPHSWPSLAYIVFNFQVEVELPRSQPALRKRPLIVSVVRTLVCAGTLIGRKTIITAAHCIIKTIDYNFNSTTFKIPVMPNSHYPTIESMYRVYLGVHDKSTAMAASFNGSHDPWESEMKRVARINIHPDFDAVNKLNDLAVITLADEIEFSPRVQIACLPPPSLSIMSTVAATAAAANRKNKMLMIDAALKKSEAWIVGWGSMYEGGPMVEWLRNARLEVFDGGLCRDVVKEFKKNWTIQICAGDLSGKHDSCQGDSGGPLFSKIKINDQSRYYLSGIVSYGEGCGEPNKPGIYTRISAYIDWIQENIEY